MSTTTIIRKKLAQYPEFAFLLRFGVLMPGLYYSNHYFNRMIDPLSHFYSPLLHHYFHYYSWFRASILYAAKFIAQGFGIESYIDELALRLPGGPGVILWDACLGIGLMCFWAAFMLAQDDKWLKKIKWCLAGLIGIWFINCWRIALLLIALKKKWEANRYMDHHDMFNLVVYVLIFILIYIYYKKSKQELAPIKKLVHAT